MSRIDAATATGFLRVLPGWRANLMVFGLLIGLVLVYFFWQVRRSQDMFSAYAREHARMLAGVIELNARGALLSHQALEEIVSLFLGNTARFVEYLDGIEPFRGEELAAFARENGLDAICVIRSDGSAAQGGPGPPQIFETLCQAPDGVLRHLPLEHLYAAAWPGADGSGCVGVALKAAGIEHLQERIGIDRLLQSLSDLAAVRYVRLGVEVLPAPGEGEGQKTDAIRFVDTENGRTAEVRRSLGDRVLTVGINADQYVVRVRLLWGEFVVFSAVLAALGGFFSWVLFRFQQRYLLQTRAVERTLAVEREDAALGRSAAAIAHEIKNPLNAISMGLQRLQMEACGLSDADRKLIVTLQGALDRADGIVGNLRRYAMPLVPVLQPVRMEMLVRDVLRLYRSQCAQRAVELRLAVHADSFLQADRQLLSQAIENLIKNSVEAQPDGGIVRLSIDRRGGECVFRVENGGLVVPEGGVDRILEPYYTTKARGTGLGLAIVRRVVAAHGGRVTVATSPPDMLCVTLFLPSGPDGWRDTCGF